MSAIACFVALVVGFLAGIHVALSWARSTANRPDSHPHDPRSRRTP